MKFKSPSLIFLLLFTASLGAETLETKETALSSDAVSSEISTNCSDQIQFVTVGDAGNAPDFQGLGSVAISYEIGKYEVTAEEYCAFLNAVASKSDLHHLYKKEMGHGKGACIIQSSLEDGSFSYTLLPGAEKFPITCVSLYDAERFCNWLENSMSATEVSFEVTERGAYDFAQEGAHESVTPNQRAHYRIPTHNEWMKAAYYKGNGLHSGYWLYPTKSDAAPGNGSGNKANQANYQVSSHFWSANNEALGITPVNFFEESTSAYGVSDMGGNVAEWAMSNDSFLGALILGGSWKSKYYYGIYNDLMRPVSPEYRDPSKGEDSIGFRIVHVPDANEMLSTMPIMGAPSPTSGSSGVDALAGTVNRILSAILSLIRWGLCLAGLVLILWGIFEIVGSCIAMANPEEAARLKNLAIAAEKASKKINMSTLETAQKNTISGWWAQVKINNEQARMNRALDEQPDAGAVVSALRTSGEYLCDGLKKMGLGIVAEIIDSCLG